MKLIKELELLIEDLLDADQPAEEIARQVLSLVRRKDLSEIIDD